MEADDDMRDAAASAGVSESLDDIEVSDADLVEPPHHRPPSQSPLPSSSSASAAASSSSSAAGLARRRAIARAAKDHLSPAIARAIEKYAEDIRAALRTDFADLFNAFAEKGSLSYAAFREVWKELGFMQMQVYKRQDHSPARHMQCLYNVVHGFLYPAPQVLSTRIAIIYALYTLYETQLTYNGKYKIKINVSRDVWGFLVGIFEEARKNRIVEAYKIFLKLKDEDAFVFAVASIQTTYLDPSLVGDDEAPRSHGLDSRDLICSAPMEVLQADKLAVAFEKYKNAKIDAATLLGSPQSDRSPFAECSVLLPYVSMGLHESLVKTVSAYESARAQFFSEAGRFEASAADVAAAESERNPVVEPRGRSRQKSTRKDKDKDKDSSDTPGQGEQRDAEADVEAEDD
eukprot:m51a1_g7494 hypothetical protein (403) ;mRNA; r:255570-257080